MGQKGFHFSFRYEFDCIPTETRQRSVSKCIDNPSALLQSRGSNAWVSQNMKPSTSIIIIIINKIIELPHVVNRVDRMTLIVQFGVGNPFLFRIDESAFFDLSAL